MCDLSSNIGTYIIILNHQKLELVGGVEHELYFPYIGNNHPN